MPLVWVPKFARNVKPESINPIRGLLLVYYVLVGNIEAAVNPVCRVDLVPLDPMLPPQVTVNAQVVQLENKIRPLPRRAAPRASLDL